MNAGAPAQDAFMVVLDSTLPASPQDWLRHSLQLIGFSLAFAYALFLAGSAFERAWLIDGLGGIIDNDFIAVWAAGRLVLDGHPAAAYDWSLHREVEVAVAGYDFASYYGWHYPPTFLFAAAPLATLPYLVAWAVWLAITMPAYVVAVRAIIGERIGIVLALGFPGVLWNISVGQNGFLTAALIGGTLVCQINMTLLVFYIFYVLYPRLYQRWRFQFRITVNVPVPRRGTSLFVLARRQILNHGYPG